jgi:1-acyl-sn-glycerol-3-phosphate acyltransferase
LEKSDWPAWRLFVTGLSFTLFGLAALVLGFLVFPGLLLLPGGQVSRRRRARHIVQRALRLFVWIMDTLGGLSYEFDGAERLGREGQLIIANHPTLLDVVFLVAFTPAPCCVVKAALWRNPFTRLVVQSTGYISNFPTDEMIEGSIAALEAGESLILFPEGTRTRPGQPMQFHRGAASIAVRGARILTPVYASCSPLTLTKFEPWYRIPPKRPHFSFAVGSDIDMEPYRSASAPVASRALNKALLTHYLQRLAADGRQ